MITRYGGIILIVAVVMAVASGARFYFISVLGERVLTDLRRPCSTICSRSMRCSSIPTASAS